MRWTCLPVFFRRARLVPFLLSTLVMTVRLAETASAQQQPVAVIAVSGVDRLLEDVDYVFAAAGQPQHAQIVRGVIANLNELCGLDRQRPVGVYLFFPIADQKDPQPLFFFPVSSVEELTTSVRIGNALRLDREDEHDRLTLHTDEGDIPIKLQHGYAFLDPTKSGARFQQSLPDPARLLQGILDHQDAVLIVRRDGVPPALFEAARGQFRGEAVKAKQKRSGESDAEFALRREVTERLLALAEAVVTDWRSASVGLRLSAQDRIAELDASVILADDGETSRFLAGISGDGTRFRSQLTESSALFVSTNWQPTEAGRELLRQLLTSVRGQIGQQAAHADAQTRSAVEGLLDSLETTAHEGQFDAFARLSGTPPNAFVLLGGVAIGESEKLAAALERLLPLAAESKDIRSIEMAVGRAGDVAIHRMVPTNLRPQDRRLYGDGAAVYLAAGEGAVWLAIGAEGTLEALIDTIEPSSPQPSAVLARPRFGPSQDTIAAAGPSFLSLTMHASDWVGMARTSGGGKKARFAELARAAFANPDEDRFHLSLSPTPEGLRLQLTLDEGYIRLFGLALSERLQQDSPRE